MKRKVLIIIVALTPFLSLSGQSSNEINLIHINADSLKRYVESVSNYRLFFTDYNENERFSLSLNVKEIVKGLENQLIKYQYVVTERDGYIYVLKNAGIITTLSNDLFVESIEEDRGDDILELDRANVASLENKIYYIGNPNSRHTGKSAILTGYITNKSTGEPIIDAGVMVEASDVRAALSDEAGYYRITLPVGEIKLVLKAYGMEDTYLNLQVYESGSLDINMSEIAYSLTGASIMADRVSSIRNTKMGIEKIRIDRIKLIPSVFGETDVLKVVLTLPGVKSVGETAGGFNVRGGASDQNLILFNGGTIYNPTHLFGMFSSFNPDIVSDVELFKSSIPAKYGGRISSVLEVNSRSGNTNKVTGSAGIGLLTGKLHLEGPLFSEKTSFITGLRTSYSNWILKLLPEDSGYNSGAANFFDLSGGVTHRFNESNTLQLSGYYSNDGFKFSADTSYKYSTLNASIKWKRIISEKMDMTLMGGFDRYDHYIQESGNPLSAYRMSFDIEQYYARLEFNNLITDNHNITYGLNALLFNTSPGNYLPIGDESTINPTRLDSEKGLEMALFVGDSWKLTPKLTLDLGIRYSLYSALGPREYYKYGGDIKGEDFVTELVSVGKGKFVKPYSGPEFRIATKYDINQDLMIKAGFNTMRQYIHMMSNTAAAAPTDTWKLSDYNIRPQNGWQAAAGLFKIFGSGTEQVELSLEGYYKRMFNYLDYISGAQLNMNQYIERDVLETTGKAYGAEIMLKKEIGKLNGWIGYTYSRTLLKEQGDKESYNINNGEWYSAPYDKPHDIKVVANYKFTHRFSLSLNVDYATGRPITIPVGVYKYLGGYRLLYSDRNSYRIPDYFRVDFAINIEAGHRLTKLTHSSFVLGVYNLTGRRNAFSVFYETDSGRSIQGYKLSIFGAPIPYITYNIKF